MTYLQEINRHKELEEQRERIDNLLLINEVMQNEVRKKLEDLGLIRLNLQEKRFKIAVELTKLRNADAELDAIVEERDIPQKLYDELVEDQI